MVVALKPIHDAVGITRIKWRPQAVSGAGANIIEELSQTAKLLNGKPIEPGKMPAQMRSMRFHKSMRKTTGTPGRNEDSMGDLQDLAGRQHRHERDLRAHSCVLWPQRGRPYRDQRTHQCGRRSTLLAKAPGVT